MDPAGVEISVCYFVKNYSRFPCLIDKCSLSAKTLSRAGTWSKLGLPLSSRLSSTYFREINLEHQVLHQESSVVGAKAVNVRIME